LKAFAILEVADRLDVIVVGLQTTKGERHRFRMTRANFAAFAARLYAHAKKKSPSIKPRKTH
jgi:hypothetical protein